MTADSLRKMHTAGHYLFFLREVRRGSDVREKRAETETQERMREKRIEKGEETGDHWFPYALTVRERQLVFEKEGEGERERGEGGGGIRKRITASSDVYLGPDYLWLRLFRTAFSSALLNV